MYKTTDEIGLGYFLAGMPIFVQCSSIASFITVQGIEWMKHYKIIWQNKNE